MTFNSQLQKSVFHLYLIAICDRLSSLFPETFHFFDSVRSPYWNYLMLKRQIIIGLLIHVTDLLNTMPGILLGTENQQ